jgi:hypothetical protein
LVCVSVRRKTMPQKTANTWCRALSMFLAFVLVLSLLSMGTVLPAYADVAPVDVKIYIQLGAKMAASSSGSNFSAEKNINNSVLELRDKNGNEVEIKSTVLVDSGDTVNFTSTERTYSYKIINVAVVPGDYSFKLYRDGGKEDIISSGDIDIVGTDTNVFRFRGLTIRTFAPAGYENDDEISVYTSLGELINPCFSSVGTASNAATKTNDYVILYRSSPSPAVYYDHTYTVVPANPELNILSGVVPTSGGNVAAFSNNLSATGKLVHSVNANQTLKVTKGAEIGVYYKNGAHYAPFMVQSLIKNDAASSADENYDIYDAKLPQKTKLHYEATLPGNVLKQVGVFTLETAGNMAIDVMSDEEWAAFWKPEWGDAAGETTRNYEPFFETKPHLEANLYTNADNTGSVNLTPDGEPFVLDLFRVWQAIDSITENYFMEPNFDVTVLGDSVKVEKIGAPGRYQWKITPIKEGASIVKVTYGPIDRIQDALKTGADQRHDYFNSIRPENTGAIVVNVGSGGDFATGIEARNDFDVYNFDKDATDAYTYTFTPPEGAEVRVHAPIHAVAWDSGWTSYEADGDGSFSVGLKEGRNIVEVAYNGAVRYHVVKAHGITILKENVTEEKEADAPFEVGDTAKIRMYGLLSPIQKMGGVYNPGFPDTGWIAYKNANGVEVRSAQGTQYSWEPDVTAIVYTIAEADLGVLSGGTQHIGSLGMNLGGHRVIPATGKGANLSAEPMDNSPYFGGLPDIVLIEPEPVDETGVGFTITTEADERLTIRKPGDGTRVWPDEEGKYPLPVATGYSYYYEKYGYETVVGTFDVTKSMKQGNEITLTVPAVQVSQTAGGAAVRVIGQKALLRGGDMVTIDPRTQTDLALNGYVAYNPGGYTVLNALIDALNSGLQQIPFTAADGVLAPSIAVSGTPLAGAGWICEVNGTVVTDYWKTLVAPNDEIVFYYNENNSGQQRAWFAQSEMRVAQGQNALFTLLGKSAGTDGAEGTAIAGAQIYIDGNPAQGIVTEADGSATIPTENLAIGAHIVTAKYADTNTLTYDQAILTVEKSGNIGNAATFRLVGAAKHTGNSGYGEWTVYQNWINPVKYTVEDDTSVTVYDVFDWALDNAGLTYVESQRGYISKIGVPEKFGGGELSEIDNGPRSGWMYTVNGVHSGLSLRDQEIRAGDEIIWHYVDDHTLETNGFDGSAAQYPNGWLIPPDGADAPDARLTGLLISADGLAGFNFSPTTYEYLGVTVPAGTAVVNVSATFADGLAVTANGESTISSGAVNTVTLNDSGVTDIAITVTNARDEINTYNIKIARDEAPPVVLRLTGLALTPDNGALRDFVFNPAVTSYNVTVAYDAASLTVVPSAADGVEISVNDSPVASGAGSVVQLTEQTVIVVALSSAAAPAESEAYTITVTRGAAPVPYETALANAMSYLRTSVQSPGFGTGGGEWTILALARGGYTEPTYYVGYYNRVLDAINGKTKLDENKSTENSRAILGLTSIGIDASNVGGNNLVAPLEDMTWVTKQGINGAIYALIALDSGEYALANAREALIGEILGAEIDGGGWSLGGVMPDPDITAMALQALARYNGRENVTDAIVRAVAWLSSAQQEDGTFFATDIGIPVNSSETLAQVIVALSALGIDADEDARFIKNGASLLDTLLAFADVGGGFKHIINGATDAMATDQAACALAAYDRFAKGMLPLYIMSDAELLITEGAPTVDKTALDAQIAAAEAIARGSYTDASWSNLTTVLATAKTVAANADATQKAVDDAKNALTAAINGLKTSSGTPGAPTRRYATIGVADPKAHDGQTGIYYGSRQVEITDNETAFSLLNKTGLNIKYTGHREYAGYYVEEINGFGEFDDGPNSGWMYSVNGVFPDYSSSLYYLEDGDTVRWLYTRDLGLDIDAGYAIGNNIGQGTPSGNSSAPNSDSGDDVTAAEPAASLGGGGGGSVVATETVAAEAKAENGRAAATVEAAAVTDAVAKAKEAVEAAQKDDATAKAEVKIVAKTDGAAEPVKSAEVDIPAAAVKAAADARDIILTVESDVAALTLDAEALATMAETANDGDTVKIVAEIGDDSAIDLTVSVGGTAIVNFAGTVTVSLPYAPEAGTAEEDYDLLTVYRIDGDTMTEVMGARYDAETGNITFSTTHFSKFIVSEWQSPFDDIAKGDWYYKAARYAYSNGLVTGMDETTFAPQSTLTRAMLITILARDAGADTAGGDTWYSKAVDWGTENGLTDGTDMEGEITREQFATMLYRYSQWSSNEDGTSRTPSPTNADITGFDDADDVSEWAREAMAWAVGGGLITGRTATALAPGGTATRAEAATLLRRYLEGAA